MDTEKAHNGKHDGNKWTPIAVAVIGAFVGSSGTIAVYLGSPIGQEITRPDPFTGTQATALIDPIISRIDHVENEIKFHLGRHPDETNKFALRISALEAQSAALVAQNTEIIRNQERILQRLNGMK